MFFELGCFFFGVGIGLTADIWFPWLNDSSEQPEEDYPTKAYYETRTKAKKLYDDTMKKAREEAIKKGAQD